MLDVMELSTFLEVLLVTGKKNDVHLKVKNTDVNYKNSTNF